MNRCVIVGGAPIKEYGRIKSLLKEDDYNIFCDSGLYHQETLSIKADLIVGDFDSHPIPDTEIETIVLPRKKDDTDTVYAVKEALKRGYDEFLIVGVIGGRFDHSLGNISILTMLHKQGKKANIADDYSLMEMVGTEPAYIEDKYNYFSLLNVTGTAKKISIENAVFPLEDGEITCDYQYGVSNEVLKGCTAKVTVGEGELLLVKVF